MRFSRVLRVESRAPDARPGRLDFGSPASTFHARERAGAAKGFPPAAEAFTLIEVLIAGGILFMCLFAILALVSTSLRNARTLQQLPVDPAGLLAAEATLSQKLVEASDSGDFGDLYPDYRWTSQTNEIATNGLFEVDFVVSRRGAARGESETRLSILLFRPDSPKGRMSGGIMP